MAADGANGNVEEDDDVDEGNANDANLLVVTAAPPPQPQPLVILFFDKNKERTIAVLTSAHQGQVVSQYFQCRVAQGSATCLSPLYFELDGYIRENWSQIMRHHTKGLGSSQFTITVAVGALDASDKAQSQSLERQHKALTSAAAQRNLSHDDFLGLLEDALEICRLHRLGEDLDVFSVYCLGWTGNRICRQVAISLATQRLKQAQLEIMPLVDGGTIGGYSTFIRLQSIQEPSNGSNNSNSNIHDNMNIQFERERPIEYVQLPSIELTQASEETCTNKFVPVITEDGMSAATISWGCIELATFSLEQWWGESNEYAGQKLCLRWQPSNVDIAPPYCQSNKQLLLSQSEEETSLIPPSPPPPTRKFLDLASLQIEGEQPKRLKKWTASRFCSITLRMLKSEISQLDGVELCYRGSLQVVQVQIDFRALVRAYAKSLLPGLMQQHEQIQETRPLLAWEREYFRLVKRAATPTYT